MAKILTDQELAEIVYNAVNSDMIDCSDSYEHFLEDLSALIAKHFGGDVGGISPPKDDDMSLWTIAFHINECVPPDGGIYNDYDPDIKWKNGKEE